MSFAPLIADIHCHPSFKPYGQSFSQADDAAHVPTPADKTSLWYEGNVAGIDARLSETFHIAMFTQSHLAAAVKGGVQVMCISLGALEKEFISVSAALPQGIIEAVRGISLGGIDIQNFLINLVTRFGTHRLNNVRNGNAYWPDLLKELSFIRKQERIIYRIDDDGPYCRFIIVKDISEVSAALEENKTPGAGDTEAHPVTVCLVLTMEGLHNLDATTTTEAEVLDKVAQLKQMEETPFFFVTFCHHFWNGLCGHAKSLAGSMSELFDQSANWRGGFTPLGLKVLMRLLDTNTGRRILIDVKHLSYKARMQYYSLMRGNIPADLEADDALKADLRQYTRFNVNASPGEANAMPPIIVSHAAANGYQAPNDISYNGNYPAQTPAGVANPFEAPDIREDAAINLFDNEINQLGNFDCLIGIQLDAHRIAGKAGYSAARAQRYPHAYLVWNQVLHFVEIWDKMSHPRAWERLCIGSDFDGIIAPIHGLDRASDFRSLYEGLLYYARLYLLPAEQFEQEMPGMSNRGVVANRNQYAAENPSGKRLNPNGLNSPQHLTAEWIVDNLCLNNTLKFMKRHFHSGQTWASAAGTPAHELAV